MHLFSSFDPVYPYWHLPSYPSDQLFIATYGFIWYAFSGNAMWGVVSLLEKPTPCIAPPVQAHRTTAKMSTAATGKDKPQSASGKNAIHKTTVPRKTTILRKRRSPRVKPNGNNPLRFVLGDRISQTVMPTSISMTLMKTTNVGGVHCIHCRLTIIRPSPKQSLLPDSCARSRSGRLPE